MRISPSTDAEKGVSTLVCRGKAHNPHSLAGKPCSSPISEDCLEFALREGPKTNEDQIPTNECVLPTCSRNYMMCSLATSAQAVDSFLGSDIRAWKEGGVRLGGLPAKREEAGLQRVMHLTYKPSSDGSANRGWRFQARQRLQ